MANDGIGRYHFEIPDLPPRPLWRVPVGRRPGIPDGYITVRARDADHAVRRVKLWQGLDATGPAERVDEDDA